jgi:hypothetical protein
MQSRHGIPPRSALRLARSPKDPRRRGGSDAAPRLAARELLCRRCRYRHKVWQILDREATLKSGRHNVNPESAAEFSIQICTTEGRLLSEYTLCRRKNRVVSLGAAERYVRKRLANQNGAPLIIVISEGTTDEFYQTQSQVSFDAKRPQSSAPGFGCA